MQRTHPPASSWRDFRNEKGYRPHVARDIARTAAVCRATVRIAPPHLPVELGGVTDAVVQHLSSTTRPGDCEDAVVSCLIRHLDTQVERELDKVEVAAGRLANLELSDLSLRTHGDQYAVLLACFGPHRLAGTTDAQSAVQQAITTFPTSPLVAQVEAARQLLTFEDELRTGAVDAKLRTSFRRGRPRQATDLRMSVEETSRAASRRGVDGAAVADAIVRFEALKHLKLVWLKVDRIVSAGTYDLTHPDDLFSYGYLGLLRALMKYDPERHAFSTYAMYRIGGMIRDGMRAESPVPKRASTQLRKVRGAVEELTQQLNRKPSPSEIADAVKLNLDKLEALKRLETPRSFEELADPDSAFTSPGAAGGAAPDPSQLAEESLLNGELRSAFALLTDSQQVALQLLVVEERTLAEAERSSGLPAAHLRKHRNEGLSVLRKELASWQ